MLAEAVTSTRNEIASDDQITKDAGEVAVEMRDSDDESSHHTQGNNHSSIASPLDERVRQK